jgi:origin recognition complex subunit 6
MTTKTEQKKIATSILAGVEHIVMPSGRKTRDQWVMQNLTAIVGAVFLLATVRMVTARDKKVATRAFNQLKVETLSLLKQARETVVIKAVSTGALDEEAAWEDFGIPSEESFDQTVERIEGSKWLEADWFSAIQDIVLADAEAPVAEDGDASQDGPVLKLQMRRADTMLQDRYDFTTEERREEYRVWSEGILQRIEQLERIAPQPMEIDS